MNKTLSAIALSCAISTSVYAGDISYNFIEGAIITNDVDGADSTFALQGSYDVASNINLVGGFASTGLGDINGVDVSLSAFSVGVGYHKSVNDSTDVYGDIQYISYDIDFSQGNAFASVDAGNGFGINLGLRHTFTEKFEGEASINYVNIEDVTDTSVSAQGRYYFTKQFSASLGYSTADDSDLAAALRYNF
ncbi:MAG: outer membrane beta-barrel protein [Thiotrichaceae bacterium]